MISLLLIRKQMIILYKWLK